MSHPVVEIRQPDRRPIRLVLTEDLELGRDCDGMLLADPGASRRHVRLEPYDDGAGVRVRDLGSTNGTTVNGRPVTGPTPLTLGDRAVLGGTELVVVDLDAPAPPADPPIDARSTVSTPVPRPVVVDERTDPRESFIARVAHLVEKAQRPGRGPVASDSGDGDTITIVFSDIEASTEHALRLGDGRWYDVLGIHNSIVRNNLLRHGGTEIKSQGDGFMLTFTSARRAVQFAVDVQRALTRWSEEHPDDAVRIRIGMHTGEAVVGDDGDLFGKHVIVAARIANHAEGGEILASHIVVEITSNRGDLDFGEARPVTLKGIDGEYTVHPVGWASAPLGDAEGAG